MRKAIIASFLLIPLAGCTWFGTTPDEVPTDETPIVETNNVVYQGRVLPLGASIYMEGTHKLMLEDGRFVLLIGNGLVLDDYLNVEVEVFGATRPTVEAGGILMRVERISSLEQSSEASSIMSSDAASSVMSETVASSVASAMTASRIASSIARSSVAPLPASSVASVASVAAASSAASEDANAAKAAVMAKANMSPANWTQQYCAPSHVAFCFPVHKNWWYKSFGATSSSAWHVEVGPSELETLGDGPFVVTLEMGALSGTDGQVTIEGSMVVGMRAWTGNRHIVITAPASLEQAVRYVTQELKAAPAPAQ